MKMLALIPAFLLLAPTLAAAPKKPTPPNPADYTVLIHLVFSRAQLDRLGGAQQALQTVIDGRQVEMVCPAGAILAPGDYKAKLYVNDSGNTYDIAQRYDILLPDMTLRTCNVTGLGPAPTTPAT